jgi:LPXTG-motif cell wall-anchored protein
MRRSVFIWVHAAILLAGQALFAQQVTVSAKLDTNAMMIGDHVGVTLKYTGPAKSQVIWPFLPDTILQSITVIGRGKVDTSYSPDKKSMTISQQLNLTCYDSGFYAIPSIPFNYRILPDTTRQVGNTPMLLLAVHTVKVDTTQAIKPIIGPLKVPVTFRELIPWILIGLAAILLVVAGIWYYRKRKKNEPVFQLKPKVILPAHELAFRELEQLRLKKLWQSGRIKEYHSELTEILRRYIENRFHVPALEQTSSEIVDSLETRPDCPREIIDRLTRMLVLADMVKFAKAQPVATEHEGSFNDGVEFVRATVATPAMITENQSTEIK